MTGILSFGNGYPAFRWQLLTSSCFADERAIDLFAIASIQNICDLRTLNLLEIQQNDLDCKKLQSGVWTGQMC